MHHVRQSLDEAERHLLQQTDTLPPNTVGRLMSGEVVAVRDSQTIGELLADLATRFIGAIGNPRGRQQRFLLPDRGRGH